MDSAISRAKLGEQVGEVLALKAIVAFHGWVLEVDDLRVFVTMHPRSLPSKKYTARFGFDAYPQRAPSFAFVDPQTRAEGKQFWPPHGEFSNASNRQPPQLCIAGIREFHEILHRDLPWDPERYPLQKVLESIQAELTKGHPFG